MQPLLWCLLDGLLQAKDFRLYSQEVLDFGGQVSFLLLLPPSDDVCTAPGQNNPYTPQSGFLTLPLQIFELGEKRGDPHCPDLSVLPSSWGGLAVFPRTEGGGCWELPTAPDQLEESVASILH